MIRKTVKFSMIFGAGFLVGLNLDYLMGEYHKRVGV